MSTGTSLDQQLARWVEHELISPDQAAAVRGAEAAAAEDGSHVERSPLLIEAAGYLGGGVIVVAGGLFTARLWSGLATAPRVQPCWSAGC